MVTVIRFGGRSLAGSLMQKAYHQSSPTLTQNVLPLRRADCIT